MESSGTAGTLIVLLWIWVPAEPANSVENKSSLRRRKYNIKQIESGFPDSGGSWMPDLWHKVDFKRALWHQIWTHRRPTDYIRGLPTKLVKISTYFQKQSFLPAIFNVIYFRGALMFGPLGLLNLWKSVNRIRIIMGKSGCTQIRTSSSCSSENFFCNQFFCVPNILPRGLIGLLTNLTTIFDSFLSTLSHFWLTFGVISGS